jgi:exodeoxyribonuclease V gamma subunit
LQQRAARISRASPELPGGATGAVWRERELGALEHLSREVRGALAEGASRLPFAIDLGPPWQAARAGLAACFAGDPQLEAQLEAAAPFILVGVLRDLTPHGQLIYRYTARPTARDYLGAWLRHLVLCAALPAGPRRTLWLGSGARFEFAPVGEAHAHLAALALLYRSGRCLPLRFFPNSAWAKMTRGDAAAQSVWQNDREQLRSESDDPALRIALRGTELRLEETFEQLARAVFEPLLAHLVDEDQAGQEASDD